MLRFKLMRPIFYSVWMFIFHNENRPSRFVRFLIKFIIVQIENNQIFSSIRPPFIVSFLFQLYQLLAEEKTEVVVVFSTLHKRKTNERNRD
jgi:hypothetical protein